MKPEDPGGGSPKSSAREVEVFTAHLAILDFIDNEMPKLGSVAELKAALVIWRQTHGWGKLTDSIGIAQLAKQTATDAKAIQRALSGKRPGGRKDRPLAEKIGIVRHQQGLDAAGDLARTRYTWPVNERVRAKLEKAAQNQSGSKRGGGVQVTPTPGVQVTPTGGGKIAPTQSCTLNSKKESSSSEAASVVQEPITTTESTDDDSFSSFSEKTKSEQPAATVTVTATTSNPEDREALIETAREQLRLARAAGLSGIGTILPGTLAETRPPDKAITIQILECFAEYEDFEAWLKDSIHRGVARKAKDSRWGLYLADARNHAEDIALKRQAEENRRIDAEIARERQRAAEAAAVAELDQPMPWLEAFGRIQYRVSSAGRDIPRPLKVRFRRTGELIAPNDLARKILGWKRCPQCDDTGILGHAIDRDLRFCDWPVGMIGRDGLCPAGIEAQYPPSDSERTKPAEMRLHKGADWPAEEIARVHADVKSLLVAGCYSVDRPFTGDSLEHSTVEDDGTTLVVTVPRGYALGLRTDDVEKALVRIQWKRTVQIVKLDAVKPAPAAKPEAAAPHRPPETTHDEALRAFDAMLEKNALARATAAPTRPPITQADLDRAVEENRRKRQAPARMEPERAGIDLAAMPAVAGGLQ